ncbi:MAG: site-specific integrase [Arcobacteraceae bacterium]|nr:site-specific integrase [Arcobacteraceae bacterium]
METKKIKRIKENVTEVEYKKLMAFTKGDESLRENTRLNLLRTFTILYYTGLRLNELKKLRIKHIKELLENKILKIDLSKTSTERKLYLSDNFGKQLVKLFDFENEDAENRVIGKGSNKRTGINNITFIQQINSFMKKVLGDGYTSHSFRQGLLTEMGSKGINVKIMSMYIGHKNVTTTMRYVRPTDDDIIGCLVR